MFNLSRRVLAILSAVVFLLAGLVHGARVLFGWPLLIGTFEVPVWLSVVGAVFVLFLVYQHLRGM
jgi:hypothetical protein